ncbi:MAG TPA: rhomboid family intramembrane serine protease [Bacteroidales bacterium]|mgnify:CR=1 FL=1|nr:rhomboid family intramembrane serine protease [Bacteroidales bacterium]HOE04243.1 rhomboid family intramembrane serine protease [Bacteroidales bacterium]HQL70008.1 rhomboid family intramembrane serine protease [Bacteroidales bacterium]
MSIVSEIKASFRNGSVVTRLIYMNLAVFLVTGLSFAIIFLLDGNIGNVRKWLEIPADFSLLLSRPWTLITYMFTHFGFLHILFNVLTLYWFGKLFLQYMTQRQLLGVYLSGGIWGGLFFVLSYNVFPAFKSVVGEATAVGASASVMAIIFTVATLVPKHEIHMMFIGKVKLIYLALAVVIIDVVSIPYGNAGGHIAHLGGAAFGVLFAFQYRKGHDIGAWTVKIVDLISRVFRKKENIRVSSRNHSKAGYSKQADMDYNAKKKAEQDEINSILDKVARSGYGSLTASEKEKLFKMSSKK